MTPRALLLVRQVREHVQHPARLERAGPLEELGLKRDRRADAVRRASPSVNVGVRCSRSAIDLAGGEHVVVRDRQARRELCTMRRRYSRRCSSRFSYSSSPAPSPPVTARIATGEHPCGIAAGFGAVWVANDGSGTLARIDPKTNRVTQRVRVGRGACSVATGSGFVWLTNYRDGIGRARHAARRSACARVQCRRGAVRRGRAGGHVWATHVGRRQRSSRSSRGACGSSGGSRSVRMRPGWRAGAARSGSGSDDRRRRSRASSPGSGRIARVLRRRAGAGGIQRRRRATSGSRPTATRSSISTREPTACSARHASAGRSGAPSPRRDGTIWVPDKEIDRVFRVDPESGRVLDSFAGGDGAWEGAARLRLDVGDELRGLGRVALPPALDALRAPAHIRHVFVSAMRSQLRRYGSRYRGGRWVSRPK